MPYRFHGGDIESWAPETFRRALPQAPCPCRKMAANHGGTAHRGWRRSREGAPLPVCRWASERERGALHAEMQNWSANAAARTANQRCAMWALQSGQAGSICSSVCTWHGMAPTLHMLHILIEPTIATDALQFPYFCLANLSEGVTW